MIPRIIHYCWFGDNPLPKEAKKCIDSWRKYLPDYEIKEWNESNFDINSNEYVREAYENRKFAFVSDYVRLYALAKDGGIYMDVDVEMIKSYDPFLHHIAFLCFEEADFVHTGMMASEKDGIWVKELLDEYANRKFVKPDGSFDTTTNALTVTRNMLGHGLVRNNTVQDFPGLVTIFPSDYFCPKDHSNGSVKLTDNTVCIHHFVGSWLSASALRRHKLKIWITKLLGKKTSNFLSRLIVRSGIPKL